MGYFCPSSLNQRTANPKMKKIIDVVEKAVDNFVKKGKLSPANKKLVMLKFTMWLSQYATEDRLQNEIQFFEDCIQSSRTKISSIVNETNQHAKGEEKLDVRIHGEASDTSFYFDVALRRPELLKCKL